MENRPIKIVLLWLIGLIFGCYMPGGAFLTEPNKLKYLSTDSVALVLPVDHRFWFK